MVDVTVPQHGDLPDAAIWAFLAGTPPTSLIVSGLELTPEYTAPEVEVAGGKAAVDRGTMTTAHPNIDPPETLIDAVAAVQIDPQTVALEADAVNHIILDANVANDDSGTIVANTTGDAPSEASFKIGEVDTANETSSGQWRLVANDGTLTFPDESAADGAATDLRTGTVVYDREADNHYSVN